MITKIFDYLQGKKAQTILAWAIKIGLVAATFLGQYTIVSFFFWLANFTSPVFEPRTVIFEFTCSILLCFGNIVILQKTRPGEKMALTKLMFWILITYSISIVVMLISFAILYYHPGLAWATFALVIGFLVGKYVTLSAIFLSPTTWLTILTLDNKHFMWR